MKDNSLSSSEASIQPQFDPTMFELFCVEIDTQIKIMTEGLIEIEQGKKDPKLFESLMRAAHSIKGAARIVNLNVVVPLAHAMEDVFVMAQRNQITLEKDKIDQLLRSIDCLAAMARVKVSEIQSWLKEQLPMIESLAKEISSVENLLPKNKPELTQSPLFQTVQTPTSSQEGGKKEGETLPQVIKDFDKVLRISAENLNRMMGLAGESLIESRWLNPFVEDLRKIKRLSTNIEQLFDLFKEDLNRRGMGDIAQHYLDKLNHEIRLLYSEFNKRLVEIDDFIWRHEHLSDQLYHEVIKSRMRPFADGIEAFPRMARDLARQLGKEVRLKIEGKSTLVDRDILEKLESPLSHLLRNAIDHGIEEPNQRLKVGKSKEGMIKIEAHHRGGMLHIIVSDDGNGIDIENLRKKVVEKKMVTEEIAARLTESELIDFLFLPGFSTSKKLTEISGRGVGLNIVRNALQEVRGVIKIESILGQGTVFHLQLPLTLSVIRALIVEIAGEPYAFPLARIEQASLFSSDMVRVEENRQFFRYEGEEIALISAGEVLELHDPHLKPDFLSVIVLKDRTTNYGLIVDRFFAEKELVLQELDRRLGKIPNISAGALMEDGSPILVIDVEDIIRSSGHLISGGRKGKTSISSDKKSNKKRILIVDDSLTVREVESRLLINQGYEVETAVNGVDGWNAIRINQYHLIITDVDMPRMNGIELLKAIKKDPHLSHLPVIIVSYKEEEGERRKALEIGAEFYLTKSSFQDETLIETVKKVIGEV